MLNRLWQICAIIGLILSVANDQILKNLVTLLVDLWEQIGDIFLSVRQPLLGKRLLLPKMEPEVRISTYKVVRSTSRGFWPV